MGEITTRYAKRVVPSTPGIVGKDGKPGKDGETGAPGTPGSGGTGPVEGFVDLGSGTSFTIDFSAGAWFRCEPSGDFSFAVTNGPGAGETRTVIVELLGANGLACALPSGGTWGALGEPEFAASPNYDLLAVSMRNGEAESYWMLSFPGVGP